MSCQGVQSFVLWASGFLHLSSGEFLFLSRITFVISVCIMASLEPLCMKQNASPGFFSPRDPEPSSDLT